MSKVLINLGIPAQKLPKDENMPKHKAGQKR